MLYHNEIVDGMDALGEDVPGFQVRACLTEERTVVKKSAREAWEAMKAAQEQHGTEMEAAAAKAWNAKKVGNNFGIHYREVRKRLEGLAGAADCFRYSFIEEGQPVPRAPAQLAAGAEPPAKKAKVSPAQPKAPPGGREESGGGEVGGGAEEDEAAGAKEKKPRARPVATGYKLWAAEQREAFKVLHPELADKSKHQELRMAMMRHYQTVVTPDERAAFEARARQIMIDKGQAPLAGMDAVMGDAGETEPAGKAEGEGEPLGRCSII